MIYHHTMTKMRIGITLDERSVERLDRLVSESLFENRSQAIQQAVEEKLERIDRTRLARECAKLDPAFEKAMAEEGLGEDLEAWPEY